MRGRAAVDAEWTLATLPSQPAQVLRSTTYRHRRKQSYPQARFRGNAEDLWGCDTRPENPPEWPRIALRPIQATGEHLERKCGTETSPALRALELIHRNELRNR